MESFTGINIFSKACYSKPTSHAAAEFTSTFVLRLLQLRHPGTGDCGTAFPRYNPLFVEKSFQTKVPRGFKGAAKNNEQPGTFVWDNGKDWRNPSTREGGWIRIYPLTSHELSETVEFVQTPVHQTAPRGAEREVKNSVLSIQK